MPEFTERPSIALHGIRTVTGRYVIGRQTTQPGINLFGCRLRMISSDAFRVTAPVIPEQGEVVTASFGPLGTVGGPVERQVEDGFVVTIAQDEAAREKLNSRITAFSERIWTGAMDRRADRRFMPRNPRTVISRPDSWSQPCLIMDYSIGGAALSAAFQPAIGEVVTIGQVTAEVVRLFDVGFAVRFFEPQDVELVESLLEAPDEWRAMMRRSFPLEAV
ncbi:PilZ domain-containing protein [Devosia chinhatensis]|uniref:PilZ domain-containing protein n=1 Tax=Devosia chinhatensis TaxID=429727 RepID=A0A0F5FM55_9HYPH|nr:PilZ domain-containing protein [Devosia chinhatensis]KKB09625.1 hypothetical protein VE26_07035 [Devosia chinhatensis]